MTNIDPPIFLHSLFRSGSTYFFKSFRHAEIENQRLYTAFQEPLHEQLVWAATDRTLLLSPLEGEDKGLLLRHPHLNEPYFKEAYDTYEAWRPHISENIIYDDYFGGLADAETSRFYQSMIDAAARRPVFQDCRTSHRIKPLKKALGGIHIHHWRNPWDQWWSMRVSDYFDAMMALILDGQSAPAAATRLMADLGFPPSLGTTIGEKLNYVKCHPMSAASSYRAFYFVWISSLIDAMSAADISINVDLLSSDRAYLRRTHKKFERRGISGIDFSDCCVPQGLYVDSDHRFFEPLETSIEEMLIANGLKVDLVEKVKDMRRRHQVDVAKHRSPDEEPLHRSASALRGSFRQFLNERAEQLRQAQHENAVTHLRLQGAVRDVEAANGRADEAVSALKKQTSAIVSAGQKVAKNAAAEEKMRMQMLLSQQEERVAALQHDHAAQLESRESAMAEIERNHAEQLSKQEGVIAALQANIADASSKLVAVAQQNAQLGDQVKLNDLERERLKDMNAALSVTIDESKALVEQLELEKSRLMSKLELASETVDKLTKELGADQHMIKVLETELAELHKSKLVIASNKIHSFLDSVRDKGRKLINSIWRSGSN